MTEPVAFERELGEMAAVGAVGRSSFRLWLRVTSAPEVILSIASDGQGAPRRHAVSLGGLRRDEGHDSTYGMDYPGDVPGAEPLTPGRRYELRVERSDGSSLGGAFFETAPDSAEGAPDRFSIAVMSCHQPYDDEGNLNPYAERLLKRLPEILETYAVKRVLLLGDQMYADTPEPLSLFGDYFCKVAPPGREHILECSAAEVRRLYQQRHRIFFNSPGFHRVQSSYPCLAAIDDHEIIDNFGSDPEHATARWQNLRRGALQAVFDYQGLRAHSGEERTTMDFGLRYGPFASYTLDLRSERATYDDRMHVFGEGQLARLRDFLCDHADATTFALGLSVPLVHLPDWASALGLEVAGEGTDVAERWSNPKVRDSRAALVELLSHHQRAHPEQKLVLLGGDVHVGMLARLRWAEPPLEATQLTSSAVSNSQEGLEGFAAKHAAKLVTVRSLPGGGDDGREDCEVALCGDEQRTVENPFGGLNVGIVQFQRPVGQADHAVELKLIGLEDDGRPREVAWSRL